MVIKYIKQKTGVRHNTEANYKFVINLIRKEDFGAKRIDKVKLSDAKAWLIKLQADGRGYSTVQYIQERAFLEFVKNDKHFCKYYEGIYILFKTRLRISEFVGLQKSDIDFEENTIRIDHQLQRKRDMEYIIEETKTLNGERILPMTKEVRECFETIISKRRKPKVEPTVRDKNGKLYHGFLYLDQNDMPMVALHWEKYFQHILTKYNNIYKEEQPKITPHVCRHTYCSNMAKSGMNPKTLQYLMGHSDIGVTLNTYTHLGLDDAKEEIERIAAMA